MTLSFSTRWPEKMGPRYAGKRNYFANKIIKWCWQNIPEETNYLIQNRTKEEEELFDRVDPFGNLTVYQTEMLKPKIHTIREDSKDRWRAGVNIHPVINNRTKDRFQFAPVMEVKSIQNIEIIYDEEICNAHGVEPVIKIDGRAINFHYDDIDEYDNLAVNDGFESVHQFCSWFDKDFTGKIIHWTDFKY